LEVQLHDHISSARSSGATISGQYIQAKARQIAHTLGITRFVGTRGWLHNFLSRHRMALRRITSTGRGLPDNSRVTVTDHLEKLKNLAKVYRTKEIFNMDETNIQLDFPSDSNLFVLLLLNIF